MFPASFKFPSYHLWLHLLILCPIALAQENVVSESVPLITENKKEEMMIKAIEIEGNKTIGLSTILTKLKTRVGQPYYQNVISDDLKRLYNTGFFSDVRVDRKEQEGGFKVIFYVVEKSIVEEITFSRIRYFKPKFLKGKMKTQTGQFLDRKALNDDINMIKEIYTKKGLTTASVDVETFTDETTGKTSLHFILTEGFPVKIRRIHVYGNRAFPDKRILKAIKSRPASLFTSGYLKEELLKEDMDRVASFYEQQGYIDAQASYTLDYLVKGLVTANINIDEGKRYFIGDVAINGHKIVSTEEIRSVMKDIQEGKIFSRDKLSVDVSNIRTLYFDKGYIFANVVESTALDPQTGEVKVTLDVEEGSVAYLEKIKIQGNMRTKDTVIRRELRMFPGDQFDGKKLRRSKDRLRNLEYFEDVGFDIEDTDVPDRKNLVVQVKEAKTGSFSFGGGYSTVDQVVGFVEIEQRNFDLMNWPNFTGGGQNLTLRAETGSTRNNTRLSFTEPWLFDYPLSAGFDAYRTERNRERDIGFAFDETRTGGDVRMGKELSEHVSVGAEYRLENIEIDNFEAGVSADLAAEKGENLISSLGLAITRDERDSGFNPTQGWLWRGSLDLAGGFLGGDKDFYRWEGSVARYIPFIFNSVLELRGRAGIVDAYGNSSKVPIFERFFAGGARSIRGYDERKVGPLDSATNDPIGGESLLVGNIEYTIPLIEFIKIATFFDVGNVWSKLGDFASGDYKSGMGAGLRVKTPIGPISLDYGYPLNDEPGEEGRTGKFYFSVSRGF